MQNSGSFLALILAAVAVGCGDRGASSPATVSPSPTVDPCVEAQDPELLLACQEFSQQAYWLGPELTISDADDLVLISSYVDDGDEPISPGTRLVVAYEPASEADQFTWPIYLTEWHRPAWDTFTSQFTGYDPSTVPPQGPINWWQHPCVEEQTYTAANGAEVHLFKAHLMSLNLILPMTSEEVSLCLKRPIGAFGAHIYFERTVVEFSVQNDVRPTELEQPVPVGPGATPPGQYTPAPLPTFVLRDDNPYNDEAVVRRVIAALQPYEVR